jgi:hypothetical protein
MVLALAVVLGAASVARGELRPRAVIVVGPSGDVSLRVGERLLWRGSSAGTQVVSDVVWSRAGDAVAFATRDRAGRTRLVVVMVAGDAHGQSVSWAVPTRVLTASRPVVVWLDARRLLLGASALQPALVASWTMTSR